MTAVRRERRESGGGRRRRWPVVAAAVGVLAASAAGTGAGAQDLADYDYENLGFRGVAFEGGFIFPDNVDDTHTLGARVDLGYLGPGLRIVPSVTYWSSVLTRSEVGKLERQLEELVVAQSPPGTPRPDIDLSPITWRDVALSVDGQFVWSIPPGLLGYAGLGASAHLLDGQGEAIDGTFVEDLLDSIRAGFNVHGGLEYPAHERFRLYSTTRFELMGDLRYLEVRLGAQFMVGGNVPGEEGL